MEANSRDLEGASGFTKGYLDNPNGCSETLEGYMDFPNGNLEGSKDEWETLKGRLENSKAPARRRGRARGFPALQK